MTLQVEPPAAAAAATGGQPAASSIRRDAEADRRLLIGIVGGGAAGLTAAHLLQRKHDIVLLERNDRVGGHVNTVTIEQGPDKGVAVDTGFIVYNERNYPLFTRLLAELGVATRASDMSFSYHSEDSGLQYCGTSWNGLFAQRRNLARPYFWNLLRGIAQFSAAAREALATDRLGRKSLQQFLDGSRCGKAAVSDYVLPLAAAIWSGSRNDVRNFPAVSLLRFFDNHGLLRLGDRPQWRTIVGGSQRYVGELRRRFQGEVITGAEVREVRRFNNAATVDLADGTSFLFDRVVLATHADQTLAVLKDADEDEAKLLGRWRYNRSTAVLHTDESWMPPNRRAWASWNYRRPVAADGSDPVVVTYHMNRLQGLRCQRDYFVSLNPTGPIASRHRLATFTYDHPQYTWAAVATQGGIMGLNGRRNTYYCGSWLGYGFHEDAVRSGVAVARAFGLDL